MKNKSATAYATPQTVAGHKVYPCAYGHIHWLTERKNPVMTQKGKADDYALAEICFAFTSDPKTLQGIKGAAALQLHHQPTISSRHHHGV
jgi:hypothetical protein